jgi:tetratricopeptide (TPR) repeat protein
MNKLLGVFGLSQEATRLAAEAQAAVGEAGSPEWFLAQSNCGEQLFADGRLTEAAQVFRGILTQLGDAPNYRRAMTLGLLGRCFYAGGRSELAAQCQLDALVISANLEQTDSVRRERASELVDLADALRRQGNYSEARERYEEGLKMFDQLNDLRSQGATLGQLGTLAMEENDLQEAADRHRAALALFQRLREPAMEAVAWHQLGIVFWKAQLHAEADRHFRESARIEEERGNLASAAQTWNALGVISQQAGNLEAAELWYRKTIEANRALGIASALATALSNISGLLQTQPGREVEARQMAEEALSLKQTLDPGAAEIWKTYGLLALIADQEAAVCLNSNRRVQLEAEAHEHRHRARDAKRKFAGTRHELRRLAPIILATVAACAGQPEARKAVSQYQKAISQNSSASQSLSRVLDRLLAGERDETALCEGLDFTQALIVETIVQGLADPATLADLLPIKSPEAT